MRFLVLRICEETLQRRKEPCAIDAEGFVLMQAADILPATKMFIKSVNHNIPPNLENNSY